MEGILPVVSSRGTPGLEGYPGVVLRKSILHNPINEGIKLGAKDERTKTYGSPGAILKY